MCKRIISPGVFFHFFKIWIFCYLDFIFHKRCAKIFLIWPSRMLTRALSGPLNDPFLIPSLLGHIFPQLKCCVHWIKTISVKLHDLLNYWYRKTANCLNMNLATDLQLMTIWLPANQLPIFVYHVFDCWSSYHCFFHL